MSRRRRVASPSIRTNRFAELGTTGGLFAYLLEQQIRIGVRPRTGAQRGEVQWRRPSISTLRRMLRHPIYAGVYVYGRRSGAHAGTAAVDASLAPAHEYRVYKPASVPAYLTWAQYEQNRRRLWQNRARPGVPGPVRSGAGWLTGLVVCGRCGHALTVHYSRRGQPSYRCRWHRHHGY